MSTLKNFNVKSGLSVGSQFIDVIDANGDATFNSVTTGNLSSAANITVTGNLIPSSNSYTLGTAATPWADAFFGPNSITILDASGNLSNSVVLENSGGNTSLSAGGFIVNHEGNSIFRIEALTGQIISNAKTIIINETDSANITTGSLQTAGGAAIAKNLHVGGNITAASYFGDGSKLSGVAPTVQVYEFANTASDVATYKTTKWLADFDNTVPPATVTVNVTTTPTLLAAFITDVGYPGITVLPIGLVSTTIRTTKSSGNDDYFSHAKIYKRSVSGVETLILTTENSSVTDSNDIIESTIVAQVNSTITLDITDRIVTKIYAQTISHNHDITLTFDNNTSCGLQLPALPVAVSSVVPYTGATGNVDLGSHSLTASNVTVTGKSNLGNVGNVIITGGTGGQVLITDGAGNVSWGSSPASTVVNGTSNVAIPTINGPLSFSVGGTVGVLLVNRISSSLGATLLPQSNNTHNLGNASFRWREVFAANANVTSNVSIGGTLTVANITANTSSATGFFVFPSYTSTAIRAITGQVGWTAAVSDSTPGGKHAYWDTTNARWSYVNDDSAV